MPWSECRALNILNVYSSTTHTLPCQLSFWCVYVCVHTHALTKPLLAQCGQDQHPPGCGVAGSGWSTNSVALQYSRNSQWQTGSQGRLAQKHSVRTISPFAYICFSIKCVGYLLVQFLFPLELVWLSLGPHLCAILAIYFNCHFFSS